MNDMNWCLFWFLMFLWFKFCLRPCPAIGLLPNCVHLFCVWLLNCCCVYISSQSLIGQLVTLRLCPVSRVCVLYVLVLTLVPVPWFCFMDFPSLTCVVWCYMGFIMILTYKIKHIPGLHTRHLYPVSHCTLHIHSSSLSALSWSGSQWIWSVSRKHSTGKQQSLILSTSGRAFLFLSCQHCSQSDWSMSTRSYESPGHLHSAS